MNVDPAQTAAAWRRACDGPAFKMLQAERLGLIKPLLIIYLGCYGGLSLLCGFARPWAGLKILGPLNLGYTLIGANYLVAWGLALIYLRVADRRFDALAIAAIEERNATLAPPIGHAAQIQPALTP